jgi:hypothetical protein
MGDYDVIEASSDDKNIARCKTYRSHQIQGKRFVSLKNKKNLNCLKRLVRTSQTHKEERKTVVVDCCITQNT